MKRQAQGPPTAAPDSGGTHPPESPADFSVLYALALLLLLAPALLAAPSQWLRIESRNFEIFTSASEREGRDLMRTFEQIRGFFEKAAPVPLLDQFPVRIIAFGSADQFRPFAPHSQAVAFASSNRRSDYIVLQNAAPESHAYAIHEYVHVLVRHSGLHVPAWLNEGWADVYSTLRPVRDGVAVGDLIAGRVEVLQSQPWLDFNTLTTVTNTSPIYTEGNRIGIFYAESWALVHMLFLSPEYSEGFAKFLTAIHQGHPAAEACRTAWNRSPEQVFSDLHNYLNRKKLYGRIFEAPLGKSERDTAETKVDDFDSRLMLADLTALLQRVPEARHQLEALGKLEPSRPEVPEALGYLAWDLRDISATREQFEKAFAAGGSDPHMCYDLALMERDSRHLPESAQALERAIKSKPDFTDAILQLGLIRTAMRQYPAAIDTLSHIGKVTATHATPLFTALAYAWFENGDLDKARANAQTAKKWARNPQEANGVEVLLEIIEARAKSPMAPKPGEKTDRAEGILQEVRCEGPNARLVLAAGQTKLTFELPDPKSVEFTHLGGGPGLQLACGPQPPLHLIVDFAEGSGIVRRIEF